MSDKIEAKSIIESDKGALSWKPKKGLIPIKKERAKLFRELLKIPGKTPLIEIDSLPNRNRPFF